jgi:lysyl-tRNA synthetase class 2
VLLRLKETQDPCPYPHKFEVEHTIKEFRTKFDLLVVEKGAMLEEETSVAGRVMAVRSMGAGLLFYDL